MCVSLSMCALANSDQYILHNKSAAPRANLEINYAKGLQKLAAKLSKALQSTKKK